MHRGVGSPSLHKSPDDPTCVLMGNCEDRLRCMYVEQKQQQHIRVTNGQPLATDQTQGTGGRDKPPKHKCLRVLSRSAQRSNASDRHARVCMHRGVGSPSLHKSPDDPTCVLMGNCEDRLRCMYVEQKQQQHIRVTNGQPQREQREPQEKARHVYSQRIPSASSKQLHEPYPQI